MGSPMQVRHLANPEFSERGPRVSRTLQVIFCSVKNVLASDPIGFREESLREQVFFVLVIPAMVTKMAGPRLNALYILSHLIFMASL